MADGFAIYSDVATRYVKVFEVQKEHSIFGCTLEAHTGATCAPTGAGHPSASPLWVGTRLGHGTGIWAKVAAAAH